MPKATNACSTRNSPDNNVSAADVSRHVDEVDAIDSPIAAPNATRIELNAAAVMAPPITGLHETRPVAVPDNSSRTIVMSAQTQEGKHEHDHHDETDQINETIHWPPPGRSGYFD